MALTGSNRGNSVRAGRCELMRRIGMVGLLIGVLGGLGWADGSWAADLRPALNRPELIEVGDPVLIGRDMLQQEMLRNVNLRDHITLYGWPDYAEIQEVRVLDPLASYEVRLYYLRRDQFLAYSRVYVSPVLANYGVRTYEGAIPEQTLERLLTAAVEPLEEPEYETMPEPDLPGMVE